MQIDALGLAGEIELFVVPHPLGGISDEELDGRAAIAGASISSWLDAIEA